jgi:myosin heavy subunit
MSSTTPSLPPLGKTQFSRSQPTSFESTKGNGVTIMSSSSSQTLNPELPSFERQNNQIYGVGEGSKIYPTPQDFPEVKEYMTWRLKRNKKRFLRLDRAASMIQRAYRSFVARRFVKTARQQRAAISIQSTYRGWKGRLEFKEYARLMWAVRCVQNNWRGHKARMWMRLIRQQIAAVCQIQRIYRGHADRKRVFYLRNERHRVATMLQCLWRRRLARRRAFLLRRAKHACVLIQRVYRGHLGRRRAAVERDKYVFSKTQTQGIAFGRQMLLEHKLHATRLQSDVTLLSQEKAATEEEVEILLEEITEFEESVKTLEKEMHQLSKLEAEAAGILDQESRFELREQKIRLDKEFGIILGKIADRKSKLRDLEKKLGGIDRSRQEKEEELRTLERKLVVLLEEQQRELDAIKRRQEKRGEMLLKTQQSLEHAKQGHSTDSGQGQGGGSEGGNGGGSGFGPTAHEKKQAAQLMQSTETLMKFGFMSMSMTYFSAMNMVKAMRTVGAQDTLMAAVSQANLA